MNYKWENRIEWDNLRSKKILIAGGTGFIGQRVVKILEGHDICSTVLTRKKRENTKFTEYKVADLSDKASLENIIDEYDILVYLAANIPLRGSKRENYQDALWTTLVPFVNFLTAFVHKGSRLVYASSVDALGICDIYEYKEDALIGVSTPYGLAKYCGEFYARNICATSGAECIMLRLAQVYGPDEPMIRIIPIIRDAISNDKKFEIWTDGSEKRRFLYVDDAVQAIVIGMDNAPQGVYNIAGNEVVSMKRLVELMIDIFEKNFSYTILNKIKGVDNVPGIDLANDVLNFSPEVGLRDGLKAVKENGYE